jgi:hypothetical protein
MARLFVRANNDSITPPLATWALDKVTIGAWVNFTSLPSSGQLYVMEAVDSSTSANLRNRVCGTRNLAGVFQMTFQFTTGIFTQTYHADWSPSIDTWYHLLWYADAATNPDTMEMYIDGVAQTVNQTGGFTNNMPGSTNSPTARLGVRQGDGNTFFDGRLAHAFVTFDQWSAVEIAALAEGYSPRMFPNHGFFDYPFSGGLEEWYLPLIGRDDPETSPIAPHTATVSGADYGVHPPMLGWM